MTPYILPISARNRESLSELAQRYRVLLQADGGDAASLRDVCYTASVRRSHHDSRLAAVAETTSQMVNRLDAFLAPLIHPDVCVGEACTTVMPVFVFSGQGSQWPAMARGLMSDPAFASVIDACDREVREIAGWSLRDAIAPADTGSPLADIDVIQPAIFAVQVALTALWRSWGVQPAAVVGHSMGEVAAAHVAGVLSLTDALRLICRRSQLLKRIRGGAMAIVGLPADRVSLALSTGGHSVSIAATNSPRSTVISGDAGAIETLLQQFAQDGVTCHRVNVDVASHSPHVDAIAGELRDALQDLRARDASIAMYSTVSGDVCAGAPCDAGYWVRNVREPVRFSAAIERLLAAGHDLFLEISPHPILSSAIEDTAAQLDYRVTSLGSLRRDEDRVALLRSLASLYTRGVPIEWNAMYPHGRCVRLPSYPWQRGNVSDVERPARAEDGRALRNIDAAPQVRMRHVICADRPSVRICETEISARRAPYLLDHRVQGVTVLPAVAYIDLVLGACREIHDQPPDLVANVIFREPLYVSDDDVHKVQIVFSATHLGEEWQLFSRRLRDGDGDKWLLHASGIVQRDSPDQAVSAALPSEVVKRCDDRFSADECYGILQECGLEYGPSFRGMTDGWRRDGEAVSQIRMPAHLPPDTNGGAIHPALFDAGLQVVSAAMPSGSSRGAYLPVSMTGVRVFGRTKGPIWSHARVAPQPLPADDRIVADVSLVDDQGGHLIEVTGLTAMPVDPLLPGTAEANSQQWAYEVRWEPQPPVAPPTTVVDRAGLWLIIADTDELSQQLASWLSQSGARPERVEVVADAAALTDVIARQPSCCGIIDCRALAIDGHATSDAAPAEDATRHCDAVVRLVRALAALDRRPPPLWLITRGAQAIDPADQVAGLAQAAVWGLGRVVMQEHPELRCALVDVGFDTLEEEAAHLGRLLLDEDPRSRENQFVLRSSGRYVARLAHPNPEHVVARDRMRTRTTASPPTPVTLEIARPGDLDSLTWRARAVRPPGAGEVQIEVLAAGLNFKDVLLATGVIAVAGDPIHIGAECAGRIIAVGPRVNALRVGDEVIALARESFGSVAIASARFVVRKPAHLTFAQAAAIPIVFLTAHYALHQLARVRSRERVLIHNASGGVGLAAVQLAQQAGAEIYATAGSDTKRQFLATLGIDHVMDSRSSDFVPRVMALTSGHGVDVIVNSLAAEFVRGNASILRAGGRYLDLAAPSSRGESAPVVDFGPNRAVFNIDLSRLAIERPRHVVASLRRVAQLFERRQLEPLPVECFQPGDAIDAFRHLARARHIGKVVLARHDDGPIAAPPGNEAPAFRPDATYLITGGAGALGQVVAQWMMSRGARHLMMVGRSERPSLRLDTPPSAQVTYATCDVSRYDDAARLLAQTQRTMPALAGIVHAAGVLDDGILLQLNGRRIADVMAPKAIGAWNLHRLSSETALDFFVLFSSAAAVLGSPGQGSYCAANAFLDALASYRHARGLPALSIGWGAWSGAGLAVRSGGIARAAAAGVGSFSPRLGHALLDRFFFWPLPHVAVMSFDPVRWQRARPGLESPLIAALANTPASGTAGNESALTAAMVLSAPEEQRATLVEQYLASRVSRVLRLSSSQIDITEPITRFGLDSLVAVELKHWIETDLGASIPIMRLVSGVTIREAAAELTQRITSQAREREGAESRDDLQQILHAMDGLSDADAGALAADLLASGDDHRGTVR